MDPAQQGKVALEAKKYDEAIELYTKALASHPNAVDYYIARSQAYHRKTPPSRDSAIADAEKAVVLATSRQKREAIFEAQQQRFICLFGLERFADSDHVYNIVKKMHDVNMEKNPDKAKKKVMLLQIWNQKITKELKAARDKLASTESLGEEEREKLQKAVTVTAQDVPDAKVAAAAPEPKVAPTPTTTTAHAPAKLISSTDAKKIKPGWLENQENMTIELLNARGVPKDKAVVEIHERSVSVTFPLADSSSTYEYSVDPLFAAIDPTQSSYTVTPSKISVVLRKARPGYWKRLEGVDADTAQKPTSTIPQEVLTGKPSAPAYPTSSRKGPKDWDKVVKEATRKEPKDGDNSRPHDDYDDLDAEDGGDDVNFFFKKLYKDADPDTRRAMMKSYQESNGTALSTNWTEVSKGEVETSPPDGMEAKKWT